MAVNNFAFNPIDGLANASTYPTKPGNEAAARQQIQDPPNQLRDFINNTLIPNLGNGVSVSASGLTGAVAASRYVGATASGAPTTGTFAVGDFVIDRTAVIWICTAAGTPGTWKIAMPSNTVLALSGGAKIQSGTVAAATAGAYAVTFPTAFSSIPVVTISYFTNGGTNAMNSPLVTAVAATSANFYLPAAAAGGSIQWHAIGT